MKEKDKWTQADIGDAQFLSNKYGIDYNLEPITLKNGISITTTRYEYYMLKKLMEYGASKLSGLNIKHAKGGGSTKRPNNKSKNRKKREAFEPPPYNLEDIHKFNYNEMLLCDEDKKFNKIYRIKFDHEFYNYAQIKMYKDIEKRYNEDLKNGNIDIINSFARKLSTYIRKNKLSINEDNHNYVEGSVICNIALMISKYMNTGLFDTDVKWICKLNVKDLNEFDNIYILFLLLQIFSCKYKYKKLYINDKCYRDWWAINLIRRRDKNEDTRTLGILPKFIKTANGMTNFELY